MKVFFVNSGDLKLKGKRKPDESPKSNEEKDAKASANVRTPRPIKTLVVVDWQENEEIMRAFNELVEVSGPAFENLDESEKKAAQKRLPLVGKPIAKP